MGGDDLHWRLVQRTHSPDPWSRFYVLSSQDLRSLPGANRCLFGSCTGSSQGNHGPDSRQDPDRQKRSVTRLPSILGRSHRRKWQEITEQKSQQGKATEKRKKPVLNGTTAITSTTLTTTTTRTDLPPVGALRPSTG